MSTRGFKSPSGAELCVVISRCRASEATSGLHRFRGLPRGVHTSSCFAAVTFGLSARQSHYPALSKTAALAQSRSRRGVSPPASHPRLESFKKGHRALRNERSFSNTQRHTCGRASSSPARLNGAYIECRAYYCQGRPCIFTSYLGIASKVMYNAKCRLRHVEVGRCSL